MHTARTSSSGNDAPGLSFFRPDFPLADLRPSPLNPRKYFNEAKLAELAETFKGPGGIIEPIVARPAGDHYEIVCGERRWRAAGIAALATAPVIVKTLTDAEALEVMVVENNQREDISALEEAEGFRQLLDTGYELERLAERLGRSTKYIYDRIKLKDLIPEARKLVADDRLTAGHAILLARLKPADQQRAIDPDGAVDGGHRSGAFTMDTTFEGDDDEKDPYVGLKARSVRELQRWIADHVRFDVAHFAKAAPLEYGAVGADVTAATAQPGRGKKVIAITFDHFVQPDARDGGERTFGPQSFRLADGEKHTDDYGGRTAVAPTCEYSVLGVVVAGSRDYGRSYRVCIARDKCEVHWKREIAERAKNQKLRDSGQAKKAAQREQSAHERWEEQQKREQAEREKWDAALSAVVMPALVAHLKGTKVTAALFLQTLDGYHRQRLTKLLGKITNENVGQAMALSVVDGWSRERFLASVKPFKFTMPRLPEPSPDAVQTSARKSKAKKKR